MTIFSLDRHGTWYYGLDVTLAMPSVSSSWQRAIAPACLLVVKSYIERLRASILDSIGPSVYRTLRTSHRRVAGLSSSLKWGVAFVATILIALLDLATGPGGNFSVIYFAPIAYTTWFIRARAGMLMAIVCALLSVRLGLGEPEPMWVVAGTALFHFSCFFLGIVVVAAIRQAGAQLLRQVLHRTRRLRIEAARRRKLEHQILEATAREQLRLAQDLHDGVGQYLAALSFLSRILADDLQRDHSPHLANAERLVDLIRKTNQITRQLNKTLQIPETRRGGFVSALRELAAQVEQLTGVKCEVKAEGEPPELDQMSTVMLFRIVQEAFNNSVKHARPHTIHVSVAFTDYVLAIKVINDGYQLSQTDTSEKGTGSLVMRLRAELIGAKLEAGPMADDEYKVECLLPITGMERRAA